MPRKGENIFLRKDGRWEARYVKGYSLDNRIIYGYVYEKTYVSVKRKRNDILLTINLKDKKESKDKKIFKYVVDKWLEQKRFIVKETTYSQYFNIINKYIYPNIGPHKLKDINDDLITNFILKLMKQGLSSKTIKDITTLLKQIANFGKININVNSPKVKRKNINILEIEEQKILENYITNNLNNITLGILFSLFMGLRIGEICALQWKDINIENKTLKINKTISRVRNFDINTRKKTKIIIDEPKTENAKRIIPIPSDLIPYIKEVIKNNTNENNYILTNSSRYLETRSYYNMYKKIIEELKIKNYNFHSLRHTFATRCIELGFDVKTLSEILGHSDIKITLSLYVHPDDKLKKTNMERITMLNI